MGRIIQGFPDLPSHVQTVTLGDQQFTVRFTYRDRTASWYLDLDTVDGDPVIKGRRLAPDWSPLLGLSLDNQPEGILFVRGPDAYVRADLGGELLLILYTEDELPPPDPAPPTIVVLVP